MTKFITRKEDGSYEYGFTMADGKSDIRGKSWSREEACFRLFSIAEREAAQA